MLDLDSDDEDQKGANDIDALKAAFTKRKLSTSTLNNYNLSCVDLPASSMGIHHEVTGASGIDALRSRMDDLGIGTAHNTLANEEEEEKTETTGASSHPSDRARDEQLAQLSAMLHRKAHVISGDTPMNTQG